MEAEMTERELQYSRCELLLQTASELEGSDEVADADALRRVKSHLERMLRSLDAE